MINNGDGQHPALDTITRITPSMRILPLPLGRSICALQPRNVTEGNPLREGFSAAIIDHVEPRALAVKPTTQ